MSDKLGIQEISGILAPVFASNGVRRAVLFGSYAKGLGAPNSDVDIMVDSGLRGLDFVGLIGDVHDAVRKEVDVFDISDVAPDSLVKREIRETGIVIFPDH